MGVYRRTDSETYWTSARMDGMRLRKNTGVRHRKAAEEIYVAWMVQLARERGTGISQPPHRYTVAELLTEYRATVTPGKSMHSQRRDRRVLERFTKLWGPLRLEAVSSKLIEDYMADRMTRVTLASVSKELGILKSAFTRAIRWDWIAKSPFRGITLNQEGEERLRWLTETEEAQLVAACPPWLQDMICVGVDTGLRRSNLVHLQKAWVQQQGRALMVPRQHLKAKKATVLIPLTTRAAAIIQRQAAASASSFVFMQADGRPYALDQVGVAVIRAARRAGLEDVSLHTLRHTFISRLVQAGRPLPEVAALAGHRDIKMTLRYAHLAPDHLRDGIATLEAYGTHHQSYPQPIESHCGHAGNVESA